MTKIIVSTATGLLAISLLASAATPRNGEAAGQDDHPLTLKVIRTNEEGGAYYQGIAPRTTAIGFPSMRGGQSLRAHSPTSMWSATTGATSPVSISSCGQSPSGGFPRPRAVRPRHYPARGRPATSISTEILCSTPWSRAALGSAKRRSFIKTVGSA